MTDLGLHYLHEVGRQFRGYKRMGEDAMSQLKDAEMFTMIDPESNSIAILVKHLAGNMRSRFTDFLTTDGEKPNRNRDQEFEITPNTTREEILRWWEDGWERVFSTIGALKTEDLLRTVTIRGERHTVLQAVNRQLAHYSAHVAQIIFLAKHLRSSEWKTLSIARGKSQEFNSMPKKSGRGLPQDDPKKAAL